MLPRTAFILFQRILWDLLEHPRWLPRVMIVTSSTIQHAQREILVNFDIVPKLWGMRLFAHYGEKEGAREPFVTTDIWK